MKKKRVFLMSGPPASGKSTWIRNHLTPTGEWISRDKIRFSIVKENEEYFSHEDEVFDTFIAYINQMLTNDEIEDIYVDASDLEEARRLYDEALALLENEDIEFDFGEEFIEDSEETPEE